ncbi:MAG: tRNA 2-thiouridine(34) synthase MnmA [Coriobacteriia bacterium]|nr:tRNA 2-thiouridine(34) synthase MnmA [Coriobacteriia bacterium]
MARVFVAMSGGVDSSVAAALLLEQGHEVTGITMQLWPSLFANADGPGCAERSVSGPISGESSAETGGCCSALAIRDAKRVCDLLGIGHYALDCREVFEREVVSPFAAEYAFGRTPNPCVTCNEQVKFSHLLTKVIAQGAEYLATGHYARLVADPVDQPCLARGADPGKDQSYFLYRLTGEQARHVLFPVGGLCKTEVRSIAERLGLPVADKAESQETCFADNGDHVPVVVKRAPSAGACGEIVDGSGRVLGRHEGLAHYTIGQRKGLGIGGLAEPLYVVLLDTKANRVVVGSREALLVQKIHVSDVVWHLAEAAADDIMVAMRYRMRPVAASVRVSGSGGRRGLDVELSAPVTGIAPGQALVCYREDVVIGGGVIECAS